MGNNMDFYYILEALGDGVITVDNFNKIDYYNKKAEEIIGKKLKSSENIQYFFQVRTDYNKDILGKIIEEVREKGIIRGLEKGSYIEDGLSERKYLSARISRIEVNGIFKIVISIRDVTKLIKLEKEIIEQKNNLELINDALPLGLILLDSKQKVIKTNEFINKAFGKFDLINEKVLLGELLRCSNSNDKMCGINEKCKECSLRENLITIDQSNQSYISKKIKFKHTILDKDIFRDYEVFFVKIKNNEEVQTLIILKDITEQIEYELKIKSAKDKAEEASKLKSEFMSNMSHEIRTPLNGIIGMIDLTRRKVQDYELIENLDIAKSSSMNLLNIINNILDISKIESGKITIYKKLFSIKELFDEIVKENNYKAQEKYIKLEVIENENGFDEIISDKLRIKQVLTNLVDNAIKFTERGRVAISYDLLNKNENNYELNVHVKDTGIGIEESFKTDVFESFRQADGSYTRQKGGTGLGLAISKKMIKLLGGDLSFNSSEGLGSDFFFTIPVQTQDIKISEDNSNAYLNDNNKPYENKSFEKTIGNILIVEDDKVNQKIFKKQIELDGHNVYLAENGKEAIEIFGKDINFDLIFMDIQMPVMSGLEAIDIIRKMNKGSNIPIIALTALALKEDKDKILKHSFDHYITKPVELSEITKIINKVLAREKLQPRLSDDNKTFNTSRNTTNKDKAVLNEHITFMKSCLKHQDYICLEEKSQSLVEYYNKIKNEEMKLLAFKLLINIRKENWNKSVELMDELENINL